MRLHAELQVSLNAREPYVNSLGTPQPTKMKILLRSVWQKIVYFFMFDKMCNIITLDSKKFLEPSPTFLLTFFVRFPSSPHDTIHKLQFLYLLS